MKRAILYIRASTDKNKQKNSFDVQLAILNNFAATNGYEVVSVFEEYQSAKNCSDRPAFLNAIAHVKKTGDFLIAYRCDRLGRGLDVFSYLKDIMPKVRAVEVGDREIDSLMLSVLFGLATRESEVISMRVKAGIARAKQRNAARQNGSPSIMTTAQPLGLIARKSNAASFNDRIKGLVSSFASEKKLTYAAMDERLNQFGITTRRGSAWDAANVRRVINY